MFVDEITFTVHSGKGGDGVIRWLRELYRPNGGPAGGNGGKGGDVYVRGVRDMARLAKYRGEKEFSAEHGGDGRGTSQYGKNGEDLIMDIPVGSVVTDRTNNHTYVVSYEGEMIRILQGGHGGLGNEHFKSSINRSPTETTKGKPSRTAELFIELPLTADVGFIGLPNAGKSSLLNALTNADSRVGAYPFTTVEPHLGDLFGYIIADIPGLVEGASTGKGLGIKFLKHVRKTKQLLHLISLESEDIPSTYALVRNELEQFDASLLLKEEWVVLTKSDGVSDEQIATARAYFEDKNIPVHVCSILDDGSIKRLKDTLVKALRSGEDSATIS